MPPPQRPLSKDLPLRPAPLRRDGRPAALVAMLLAVLLLIPLGAGAQDLDSVRGERKDVEDRLQQTQRELEDLEERIHQREDELGELEDEQARLEVQLEEVRDSLAVRARSAFKHGGLTRMEALVSGTGPSDAIDRAAALDTLARRGEATIESATALQTQLEQVQQLRQDTLADLETLRDQTDERVATLTDDLERLRTLETDLELRAKRQRRIDRGVQQGIYSCPVAHPYSFIDSWGFGRSGGRRHKGVDIMNPQGNDVYAFTNGRITRMKSGGLGGIVIYMWGDDGNEYYYAHLSGYAPGVYPGKRVESGELIAYNGATGNARGGAPHVHFEVHPGGGAAVNPYPWAAAACY